MDLLSPDHLSALVDKLWTLIVLFVPKLLAAIIVVLLALFIARKLSNAIRRILGRTSHIDKTIQYVASEVVRYAVLIFAFIIAFEQIGVKATSLLAALGAAGLAIGLALQGTLSNIAAGVMLLWLRPFRIGDYIEVNNVPGLAGTARAIGLFTTEIDAFDGLYLFVPNSALWNVPLRNFTRNRERLISYTVSVPLEIDHSEACRALIGLVSKDKRISGRPSPVAFVDRVNADSIALFFRIWVPPVHAGGVQRDMPMTICAALSKRGGKAAAIQITRTMPPDTDPSRFTDYARPTVEEPPLNRGVTE